MNTEPIKYKNKNKRYNITHYYLPMSETSEIRNSILTSSSPPEESSSEPETDGYITENSEIETSIEEVTSDVTPDNSDFNSAILNRSVILDNGKSVSMVLQPKLITLTHQTTDLRTTDGEKLGSYKTHSRGMNRAMILIGTIVLEMIKFGLKRHNKEEAQAFSNSVTSDVKALTDVESSRDILRNFLGSKLGTAIQSNITSAGALLSIATYVLGNKYTFADTDGRVTLRSNWSKSQKGYIIKYTADTGEDPGMSFMLTPNRESGKWELSKTTYDTKKELGAKVALSIKEDSMSAEEVRRNILASTPPEEQKENSSIRVNASGDDDGVTDIVTPEDETVTVSTETPNTMSTPPELSDFTADDPELIPPVSTDTTSTPVMEVPLVWNNKDVFGTEEDSFRLSVGLQFTRLRMFGKVFTIPITGAAERYVIDFKGNSPVPRDVLAFSTYIMRSSNTIPISLLLMFLITIKPGAWPSVANVIWENSRKSSQSSPVISKTKTSNENGNPQPPELPKTPPEGS